MKSLGFALLLTTLLPFSAPATDNWAVIPASQNLSLQMLLDGDILSMVVVTNRSASRRTDAAVRRQYPHQGQSSSYRDLKTLFSINDRAIGITKSNLLVEVTASSAVSYYFFRTEISGVAYFIKAFGAPFNQYHVQDIIRGEHHFYGSSDVPGSPAGSIADLRLIDQSGRVTTLRTLLNDRDSLHLDTVRPVRP